MLRCSFPQFRIGRGSHPRRRHNLFLVIVFQYQIEQKRRAANRAPEVAPPAFHFIQAAAVRRAFPTFVQRPRQSAPVARGSRYGRDTRDEPDILTSQLRK